MNIFKRLFKKTNRGKNEAKNGKCWYNNFHEKKRSRWSEPIEGEAFGPNFYDKALTDRIAEE